MKIPVKGVHLAFGKTSTYKVLVSSQPFPWHNKPNFSCHKKIYNKYHINFKQDAHGSLMLTWVTLIIYRYYTTWCGPALVSWIENKLQFILYEDTCMKIQIDILYFQSRRNMSKRHTHKIKSMISRYMYADKNNEDLN